jgi:hypothetical protein
MNPQKLKNYRSPMMYFTVKSPFNGYLQIVDYKYSNEENQKV